MSARIAARYLLSRKSHSAVTAISVVSVVGVAIATAAIICVLSVFNGFRDVIAGNLDKMSPDVLVVPASGKTISGADSLAAAIGERGDVAAAMPSLSDNALILLQGREMPVELKGVREADYRRIAALDSVVIAGDAALSRGLAPGESGLTYDPELEMYVGSEDTVRGRALLSVGVANRIEAQLDDKLLLFAPRRQGRVNLANPGASFLRDSVEAGGVFRTDRPETDQRMVIVDIGIARRLFQYSDEASAIEIRAAHRDDASRLAQSLQRELGNGFIVKDRLAQQEVNFRMVAIEKWVTFLLLSFILLVASFNVISTLSMLVLEKQTSMATLRDMGMSRNRIAGIFAWESMMVTLLGFLAGIVIGVGLCLLQQHFGWLKLDGNPAQMMVEAYPVRVRAADILAVLLPTAVIGVVTAWITTRFARSRIG